MLVLDIEKFFKREKVSVGIWILVFCIVKFGYILLCDMECMKFKRMCMMECNLIDMYYVIWEERD